MTTTVEKIVPSTRIEVPPMARIASTASSSTTETKSQTAFEKKVTKYKIITEIRDWILAVVFLLWGGHGIYDAFLKPKNPPLDPIQRKFDLDNDGRLSNEEKKESEKFIEDFGNWRKLKDSSK